MKRIGTWMACGALTLAFSACDNDRTTDPDGGPIVLSDSGPTTPDSGPTTPDSGPTTPDSGVEPACAEDLPPFPAALAPRCSDATRTCLNACTTSPCVTSCIRMDDTPSTTAGGQEINCETCIGLSQNYCLQENGAEALVDAFRCCLANSGCTTEACVQTMCGTEIAALESPSNPAGGACGGPPTTGEYAVCFPAE